MVWPEEEMGNWRTHCCPVEGGGTGSNKHYSECRKFWFTIKNTFFMTVDNQLEVAQRGHVCLYL